MRELVLTCVMALFGGGCVNVVPHIDEYDAGPPPKLTDASGEAEVSAGKCASGQHWTGNMASGSMNPGVPCLGSGCHTSSSKTQFTLAGTIYDLKGPHDEDNCNGADGTGMAVVPLDDSGMEIVGRLQVNGVGNFSTNKALPASYRVKVIALGREAVMQAPVTDGNCNYCHTADGMKDAKGRITPQPP